MRLFNLHCFYKHFRCPPSPSPIDCKSFVRIQNTVLSKMESIIQNTCISVLPERQYSRILINRQKQGESARIFKLCLHSLLAISVILFSVYFFLLLILCSCSSLFPFLEIVLSSYTYSSHSPNCNEICEIKRYTANTGVPNYKQSKFFKILNITLRRLNTNNHILLHTNSYSIQNKS